MFLRFTKHLYLPQELILKKAFESHVSFGPCVPIAIIYPMVFKNNFIFGCLVLNFTNLVLHKDLEQSEQKI